MFFFFLFPSLFPSSFFLAPLYPAFESSSLAGLITKFNNTFGTTSSLLSYLPPFFLYLDLCPENAILYTTHSPLHCLCYMFYDFYICLLSPHSINIEVSAIQLFWARRRPALTTVTCDMHCHLTTIVHEMLLIYSLHDTIFVKLQTLIMSMTRRFI